MKNLNKKSILQKTIIAILITLLLSNFMVPTYSQADVGGVLLNPITDLLATGGDAVIALLQRCFTGDWAGGLSKSDNLFMIDSTEAESNPNTKPTGKEEVTETIDSNKIEKGWMWFKDNYQVPVAVFSPEEIFAGDVAGLDINFINPKTDYKDREGNTVESSASKLRPTIASWYVALRNLTIVGLLSVLVYVGIRIIISTTAQDKAKYKQMLIDWLIAICLVFFLHYIMSFTLTLTESICDALNPEGSDILVEVTDGTKFRTNLLGLARFKVQYEDSLERLTYLIIYIFLAGYTALFTWTYLKRMLNIAFLTIIAPVVALTYPIDKITDGQAQAFDSWLKEYIYNVLLQPFHLIIYTVLVGSAMQLATDNPIYCIGALTFMLPAEKILRSMFGFNKAGAGTLGALSTIAATSAITKFANGGNKKPITGSKNEGSGNKDTSNKPQTYQGKNGINGISLDDAMNSESGKETKPVEDKNNIDNKDRTQQLAEEFGEQQKNEANKGQNDVSNNIDSKQDESNEEGSIKETNIPSSDSSGDKELTGFRRGMNNVISAHGGGARVALKGAKTLGRAAKFTARKAFTVAGMGVGAVAGVASGQGLAGMVAGATAGRAAGRRLGEMATNLPENVAGGVARTARNSRDVWDRTWDTAGGHTRRQDQTAAERFMRDEATEQYIRDKWTKEHNGTAPTRKEVKAEKDRIKKYADQGITDMGTIYKSKNLADKYDISDDQVARIAKLEKERNINAEDLRKKDHYESRKADLAQEFASKDKTMTPEKAKASADYVLNVIKARNGQAHDLDRILKK